MAYAAPVAFSSGQLVTSSDLNLIQTNLTALRDGEISVSSQAANDLFYASSATQVARLAAGTSGYFLQTQGAGSAPVWAEVEHFDPDAAVTINDSGADVDFRVESDGNANMIFVNGGTNQVGIGAGSFHQAIEVLAVNGVIVSQEDHEYATPQIQANKTSGVYVGGQSNTDARAAVLSLGDDVAAGSRAWSLVNGRTDSSQTVGTLNLLAADAISKDPLDGSLTVMSWDDDGKVGIGIESPAATLDVRVDGGTAANGLSISEPDVSFTMTGFAPQASALYATAYSTTKGAGTVYGFCDASDTALWGLNLVGAISSTDPDDAMPAVCISGFKSPASGAGQAALAAGETILAVVNGLQGTQRLTVKGNGDTSIGSSTFTKGSSTFDIPHPLEGMEGHRLIHSIVESSEVLLVYRGQVDLVSGQATINLDDETGMSQGTWESLCRDASVFSTNESGWHHVRGSVQGNVLTISCEEDCADTVSWLICCNRHDPVIKAAQWTDQDGFPILEPEVVPEDLITLPQFAPGMAPPETD